MIWEANSEYPGVRIFAQKMKDAILHAHNVIITARVKQTKLANGRRKESPFIAGDLVYLSTANLAIPEGHARKLIPKYLGPFTILKDYKNNTYLLDIPADLKRRGIHPAFHASLLRIHHPNDDRRFPGRQLSQVTGLGAVEDLAVSRIADHHGKGTDSLFKVEYSTGDVVWLPYQEVARLEAFTQYLDVLGVDNISGIPRRVNHESAAIPVSALRLEGGKARTRNYCPIRTVGHRVTSSVMRPRGHPMARPLYT